MVAIATLKTTKRQFTDSFCFQHLEQVCCIKFVKQFFEFSFTSSKIKLFKYTNI